MCCQALGGPEDAPWRALSYIFFTLQFMSVTLDLFMDTSVKLVFHYTISTIELIVAMSLTFYQFIRILTLSPICGISQKYTPALFLSASLILQLAVVGMTAFSVLYNLDILEWTLFGVLIVWGFVNPLTYSFVEAAEEIEADDEEETKKNRLNPSAAIVSVFTRHFTRTPLLFVFGTFFAIAQAILITYQGAVINDLTKAVTKIDTVTQELEATEDDVERLAFTLVLVWAAANLAAFIFDVLSSMMFSRLEIWLRHSVFTSAVTSTSDRTNGKNGDDSLTLADYQARYSLDVTGVVELYATLLRGVVVNVLLICTNFGFLCIYNWQVATVTLGFLVMGVTSGPTDLAGDAAAAVQGDVTNGLSLLQETSRSASLDSTEAVETPGGATPGGATSDPIERHRQQVLVPLKGKSFRNSFFSGLVDTFNNFFASFLTAVVVITMSWQVYNKEMDSSEFLGTFFVFQQLAKPATKFATIIKKATSKTANLERINGIVFVKDDEANSDETR